MGARVDFMLPNACVSDRRQRETGSGINASVEAASCSLDAMVGQYGCQLLIHWLFTSAPCTVEIADGNIGPMEGELSRIFIRFHGLST